MAGKNGTNAGAAKENERDTEEEIVQLNYRLARLFDVVLERN
jgi:hypothetical protein